MFPDSWNDKEHILCYALDGKVKVLITNPFFSFTKNS